MVKEPFDVCGVSVGNDQARPNIAVFVFELDWSDSGFYPEASIGEKVELSDFVSRFVCGLSWQFCTANVLTA